MTMMRMRRVAARLMASLAVAVMVCVAAAPAAHAAGFYPSGATGYDISWPQCGGSDPSAPVGFGIVGVNDGKANTQNPCLAAEYAWATGGTAASASVYMNLNYGTTSGTCARKDKSCQAYTYGQDAAQNAMAYASAQNVAASIWWLDIETANSWSRTTALNAQVIAGAIATLQAGGLTVGIYSTPYQWSKIAGSYAPGLPNWTAGAPASDPGSYCASSYAFGGGTVWLAQYANGTYDGDYAC